MKLTLKDKEFLERLRPLMKSKELSIELKQDGMKRLVLRQNYGDKIESEFGMTRQGVRWRFQRLFSEIYISSYESIFLIESQFGTELRQKALEIAKERVQLRQKAQKMGQIEVQMKLTLKDKDFLERLKALVESKDLSIELKQDGLKRLVLRQNYGDKIESEFGMSRQGVRWRFQRIFSARSTSQAYESIYLGRKPVRHRASPDGAGDRQERVELRRKAQKMGQIEIHRRKTGT